MGVTAQKVVLKGYQSENEGWVKKGLSMYNPPSSHIMVNTIDSLPTDI